ncbi:MAG: FAD-dependent oxidoreductase [Flavobacteriales bacterium]|nr:FAD-dependent oxidoreductase [Flavobacteriales bacterium]MDG1781759.1 FAD-dependent oxidoreductase [Flavobacteriales bacterium]
MIVDLLIVGQGLAGSVLAHEARKRGLSIAVIDNGWKTAASTVAAGMWNPVSFRKIIPVWRDEACMEAIHEAYPRYEKTLGTSFFHQLPVWRIFPNQEYADLWRKRLNEGAPWIAEGTEAVPPYVDAPFGYGVVPRAGFVKLPVFLEATREWLSEDGALVETSFDEDKLQPIEAGYQYEGIQAKHVVLAVGTAGRQLKAMEGLPLQTNKGEVLDVQVDEHDAKATLNNGKWLLPFGEGKFKLGATYDWRDDSLNLSATSKQMLLDKVGAMLHSEVKVVKHIAGLRPTVKDRRPLIGALAPNLYTFNGLGTRGVLIAPLLAAEFFDFMEGTQELHSETSVQRYQ